MGMSSKFNEAKEESSAESDAQIADEDREKACSLLKNNRAIEQIFKDDSRGSVSPLSSQSPLVAGLKKPAEVFRTDFIAGMKISESQALPNGNYLELKDTWRTEWEKGVQVPVNLDILPEIKFRVKDSNEHVNKRRQAFQLPESHINFDNPVDAVIRDQTGISSNYDLDEIDTEWIRNCAEVKQRKNEIDEITMERAITYFERKCFENMVHAVTTKEGLSIEYDESTICDVCLSPDTEEGNEIVFCDACNMCAHQVCYGLLEIPNGNWLCRPCSRGILSPPCVLCPNRGGALKRVKDSYDWVHVICAWWIPEVKIEDTDNIENITVNKIPLSRWNLTCVLCREKMGACVQCSVKRCVRAYHITCAVKEGLEMKTVVIPEKDDVLHTSYCSKHCIPQPSSEKKTKGEIAENQRLDELKKLETEFYKLVTIKQAARDLHLSREAIRKLYCFWTLKRKANDNVPLIPLTAEQKEQLSGKQGIIFIHEQMNMEAARFTILRQDLERLRNLCYMIVKREKVRRELHRSSYDVFYKQHDMLTKEDISSEDEKWVASGDQYMRFIGYPHYTTKAEYERLTGADTNNVPTAKDDEDVSELSRFRQLLESGNYDIPKRKSFLDFSANVSKFDMSESSDSSCVLDLVALGGKGVGSATLSTPQKKKRRRLQSRYTYNPPKKRKKPAPKVSIQQHSSLDLVVSAFGPSSSTSAPNTEESSPVSYGVHTLSRAKEQDITSATSQESGAAETDTEKEAHVGLISETDDMLSAVEEDTAEENSGTERLSQDNTPVLGSEGILEESTEVASPMATDSALPLVNGNVDHSPLQDSMDPRDIIDDVSNSLGNKNNNAHIGNEFSNETGSEKLSPETPCERVTKEISTSPIAGKVLQDSENIPKDSVEDCSRSKWTNGQSNGERSDLDLCRESENVDLNSSKSVDTEYRRRSSSNLKTLRALRGPKSPCDTKRNLHNYRRLSPRLNKFAAKIVPENVPKQIESNHLITLEDFERPQRITRSRQSLLKALEGTARS